MKIFAQQGFGPKDKVLRGLKEGMISGSILSPRYLTPEKMAAQIEQLSGSDAELMMDPEFFATAYMRNTDPNLGNLEKWDYFRLPKRSGLITGTSVASIIKGVLEEQQGLGFKQWIAPNVHIPKADSINTAIALNFVTRTKEIALEIDDTPTFATLVINRDAIIHDDDFREILDALTAIEIPPDGYYVIVGGASSRDADNRVRSDLYDPQVIAGWMYTNYVLSINGARVINGYSHLLSPLLGISGAEACASGWFSGLRQFSMNKYAKSSGGGRYPNIRYVSAPLLSHILQTDYLDFKAVVPEVATGSSCDTIYEEGETSRTEEALQSWEALTTLSQEYCTGHIEDDLARFKKHIDQAIALWSELQEAGFSQGLEANLERLDAMRKGISLFEKWAELD